ncbi:MAG: hypothetical protein HYS32_03040 [Candidatus Woesearchaeota archaeon]|nr:MAG: hypothetical protein HYS32_03040 [Candidatus Woesearchaeota archaeon]
MDKEVLAVYQRSDGEAYFSHNGVEEINFKTLNGLLVYVKMRARLVINTVPDEFRSPSRELRKEGLIPLSSGNIDGLLIDVVNPRAVSLERIRRDNRFELVRISSAEGSD